MFARVAHNRRVRPMTAGAGRFSNQAGPRGPVLRRSAVLAVRRMVVAALAPRRLERPGEI